MIDLHHPVVRRVKPGEAPSEVTEQQVAGKSETTSPRTMFAIFTQALGVGTQLKIEPETQEILLKAGANAVYDHPENSSKHELMPEMKEIVRQF